MTEFHEKTLAADFITPVRAYAVVYKALGHRSSFLFESVVPGERWGRYSIIGCLPASESQLGRPAPIAELMQEVAAIPRPASFVEALSRARVGWLSYDVANHLNGIAPWDDEAPLARFMCDMTIILFDNLEQTLTIGSPNAGTVLRCEQELRRAAELAPMPMPDRGAAPPHVDVSLSDDAFAAKVALAKEYIAAGDAFQIVLARRFTAPFRASDPFDVYRALRVLSPSPYLYFMHFAESEVVVPLDIAGASPETMARYADGRVTLRPIAGTRPRGKDADDDARLERELLADAKERAEHVMLVDLARNDVGRVAKPGTVQITQEMKVERFSHVMHIVSEVTGEVRDDATPADVLASAFPAGTLSGAPKVRAMQIIRELETGARNHYGGGIGYFMPGGEFDVAIAIRTVVAFQGQYELMAGAGVVEGSDPAAEAEETRNKAKAGLAAIKAAQDAYERKVAEDEAKAKREADAAAKAAATSQ
jgi:anthranilate synthase component 1